MPVNRTNSPPVTSYQHSRRLWLDTVSEMAREVARDGTAHGRAAWPVFMVLLTAACPRKRRLGQVVLTRADVETTAWRIADQHMRQCTCSDDDWNWIGPRPTNREDSP